MAVRPAGVTACMQEHRQRDSPTIRRLIIGTLRAINGGNLPLSALSDPFGKTLSPIAAVLPATLNGPRGKMEFINVSSPRKLSVPGSSGAGHAMGVSFISRHVFSLSFSLSAPVRAMGRTDDRPARRRSEQGRTLATAGLVFPTGVSWGSPHSETPTKRGLVN